MRGVLVSGRGWPVVLGLVGCSQPAPQSAEPPVLAESAKAAAPALAEAREEPRAGGPEVVDAKQPGEGEPCRNGQRLDSGCVCRSGGACFDICCGPLQDCAHPHRPGGPSACVLRMPAEANPPPPRECQDGELLADGCTCKGDVCLDICCVGSACSHGAGGRSKCVTLPKRGR